MLFPAGHAKKNQLIDESAENKYYEASYKADITSENDAKSQIAKYVDKNSVCLDVGCGVGYLAGMLSKHRDTKVYGVELDKKAVEYARKSNNFVDIYNFSITNREGEEYNRFIKSKLKFDYIMFGDLLEHVLFPDDILIFFSKFLKPKGKILVSLPNVGHFDIIRGLTNRKFNYNHSGLLDNTHLRFYTKSSFKQLIEQINRVFGQDFVVKEIGKTIVDIEDIGNYPNLYKILNQDGEACVLQYLYEISIDKKKAKNIKEEKEKHYFEEIEKLLEQRNELENRVQVLEKELNDVYSSVSWKITDPLRKGAAILKNNK